MAGITAWDEPCDGRYSDRDAKAKARLSRPSTAEAVAWRTVPHSPSMAMLNAAVDHTGAGSDMDWNGLSPQSLFQRAWFAMLAAAPGHHSPQGGAEPDEEQFLRAYVSKDCSVVGIEHETEADWNDIHKAHVTLRDRLNERLTDKDLCPYKPDSPAPAVSEAEVEAALNEWRDSPRYSPKAMRCALEAAQRARK